MNVSVTGPKIIFSAGSFHITETIVNSWIIMAVVVALCIWLTRGLTVKNPSKKQIVAEKLVLMVTGMVEGTMGVKYRKFIPYIGALFTLSILGSLSGLLGMRALTGDLSTTLGWALMTFVLVHGNSIRVNGFFGWLKSFAQPVAFLLPLNIVSEIATPISIAFRHFGNIASGIVITTLVYGALAALTQAVLPFIPEWLPILQVGLPAILSVYFDVLTSFLQAYIITMLTMVFVSGVE